MKSLLIFIVTYLFLTSSVYAEVGSYFPSTKIHEDDSIHERYELEFEGCHFTVNSKSTKTSHIKRLTRYVFDLREYETDPKLRSFSYYNMKYSSRYNMPWVAWEKINNPNLVEAINQLNSLRITLSDIHGTKKLTREKLHIKSKILSTFADNIKQGELGHFAQENYSERYRFIPEPILISFSILTGFQLPVRAQDWSALEKDMNEHKKKYCPTQ